MFGGGVPSEGVKGMRVSSHVEKWCNNVTMNLLICC